MEVAQTIDDDLHITLKNKFDIYLKTVNRLHAAAQL